MASLVLLLVQARGTRGCGGHYSSNIEYAVLIVRPELRAILMSTPQDWADAIWQTMCNEEVRNLTSGTSLYTDRFRNHEQGYYSCFSQRWRWWLSPSRGSRYSIPGYSRLWCRLNSEFKWAFWLISTLRYFEHLGLRCHSIELLVEQVSLPLF